MSAPEILWRLNQLFLSVYSYAKQIIGMRLTPTFVNSYVRTDRYSPPFRLLNPPCYSLQDSLDFFETDYKNNLLNLANKICDNHLFYFNRDIFLGKETNWHIDHLSGVQAELSHIIFVDYRNAELFGDCKEVWEPNRHHQLVVLGLAYRLSLDQKYALKVKEIITSWIDANPYGRGMNWKSPLEQSIRMISWTYAIDLTLDSGIFSDNFRDDVIYSIYLHCNDIFSKFSQGSSANNHVIGEAAGLYIASSYFPIFKESDRWKEASYKLFSEEIANQIDSDGITKEHAFGYQFFVLQFFCLVLHVRHLNKQPIQSNMKVTFYSSIVFLSFLSQESESIPWLGDKDDGYVINLGENPYSPSFYRNFYELFFGEEIPFFIKNEKQSNAVCWFYSNDNNALEAYRHEVKNLQSRHFSESNYFLLQHMNQVDNISSSVLLDCANLGYTDIAAHGHADALSFILRLNGTNFLVDSGTYDYFTFPDWRGYFRSTRAHNTIEIDGEDQSINSGLFMWEKHARCRPLWWEFKDDSSAVSAEHNGYQRLSDPVTHKRELILLEDKCSLNITDHLICKSSHSVKLHFHLSPESKLVNQIDKQLIFILDDIEVIISIDPALELNLYFGSLSPKMGWYSEHYHHKIPITSIQGCCEINGGTKIETLITWRRIESINDKM